MLILHLHFCGNCEEAIVDPFIKLPYSELSGNFIDKFGVQWGFMTE